jgi:archaellum component FlaC
MDLNNQLATIINILTNIESRLTNIEENIVSMKEDNKAVEKDCCKMREHIDFIEHTYDAVKMPLNYLKTNIEYIIGTKSPSLPLIEDA